MYNKKHKKKKYFKLYKENYYDKDIKKCRECPERINCVINKCCCINGKICLNTKWFINSIDKPIYISFIKVNEK